jgi:prepilin-type processing-associated H-X9-DG protein
VKQGEPHALGVQQVRIRRLDERIAVRRDVPYPISSVILPVLLCPAATLGQNPYTKSSGARYALSSYVGNGGTQSHPPAAISGDGLFAGSGPPITTPPTVQHGLVRFRDVIDGMTNTLLLGERSHDDPNYDAFFPATTQNPMTGWGYWSPTGGQLGLTDLTASSFARINYVLPDGVTAANFTAEETLRLNAFGSQHAGGAQFALADGSVRFISENLDHSVLRALSTRYGKEAVGEF